jgi:hypothetical protein
LGVTEINGTLSPEAETMTASIVRYRIAGGGATAD